MRYFVLPVLAVLLLAGCSALRPLSLPEARGFCNTAGGGGSSDGESSGAGSCRQQLDICAAFLDPLAGGAQDRAACLDQCRQARSALAREHAMDDCRIGVERANDLCERYCRSNLK